MSLVLTSSGEKLEITAATTIPFTVHYADYVGATPMFTPGVVGGDTINGTRDLLATPASGQSVIRTISVHNDSGGPDTITIQLDDAAVNYTIVSVVLPDDYTLCYDEDGWKVLDTGGAVSTTMFSHAILGGHHSDAATDAVTRGSLVYGNATPLWDELIIGGAHQILKVNAGATDPTWASFDWNDVAAGAGANMLHDHSANIEGGPLPLASLSSYALGRMMIGGAADWEHLAPAGAAGYALVSDATSFVWDQTPTWTGEHDFQAGIKTDTIAESTANADVDIHDIGELEFDPALELTIAAGAVTRTQVYHKIDTEADAATDFLDTINGGAEGDLLVIRAENDARTVVVRDGDGNIHLKTRDSISLTDTEDHLTLIYDSTTWCEVSVADSIQGFLQRSLPYNSKGNSFTTVQAAIDDLETGPTPGWVFVPQGTWAETLTIAQNYITLFGTGHGSVINGALAGHAINVSGNYVVVRDLQCQTTPGGGNAYYPLLSTGNYTRIARVNAAQSDLHGMYLLSIGAVVSDCYISNCDERGINIAAKSCKIVGTRIYNAGTYGIQVFLAASAEMGLVVVGNEIETTGDDGIYISANSENCVIVGNRIRLWTNEAIDDDSGTSVVANNDTTV